LQDYIGEKTHIDDEIKSFKHSVETDEDMGIDDKEAVFRRVDDVKTTGRRTRSCFEEILP
jgi:pyrimidine operon attenuation protein/uracil phosphoribosyltransferase